MIGWVFLVFCTVGSKSVQQQIQYGPDPWHVGSAIPQSYKVPPDIQMAMSPRRSNTEPNPVGDYFFKRLLSVMLKSGATQTLEDGSREILIAMKIPEERWRVLDEYMKTDKPLTDDVFRKSVGYVSDAIFKPSFAEKVVQAWSEYVLSYYHYYIREIGWILTIATAVLSLFILKPHISFYVIMWTAFIILYLYEGFLLYKEHEKKDYEMFVASINSCKWWFWSSSCQVPYSDPFAILKNMHPVKILMRMLGHFVTEPIFILSSTANDIFDQITCNLYPPFNRLAKGVLMILFNIIFLILIVMILFTTILRRSFNISFLSGLIHFNLRERTQSATYSTFDSKVIHHSDRISGENLKKIIDLLSDHRVNERRVHLSVTDGNKSKSAREGRSVYRKLAIKSRSLSAGR